MSPATARMTQPRPPADLPDLAQALKAAIAPARFYASRLPDHPTLKRNAKGYSQLLRCPFPSHADEHPSFAVHLTTGGYTCKGCGIKGGDLIDFEQDLTKRSFADTVLDLAREYGVAVTPAPPATGSGARRTSPVLNVIARPPTVQAAGSPPPPDLASRPATCPGLGTPSQTWDYRDSNGHFLMAVLRFDIKGKGKSFRPLSWQADPRQGGKATWQFKDPPAPLPLYGLDRLAQRPTAPVLLCEGEKAADAAARLLPDHVTTTTAHGAAAAAKTDYAPLTGRVLRLWPDRDAPGAAYALEVSVLARAAGAARVEVLDLGSLAMDPTTGTPRPLPEKWDAADAWTEGWTAATLTQAARWVAVPAASATVATTTPRPPPTALAVNLIRADQLRLTPVTWLWAGWLASGKLHVLAGAPGTGKTTLAMGLCATLTCGGRWPDGTRARAADVAVWSGEDDPGDTLIPRLMASGADLRRVHFVHGCSDQEGRRSFDPAHDADLLADAFTRLASPPALLVIDPIVSAVSGDSHQGSVVRRSLQPLVDMAAARRCAILGISHFSKGTQGRDPTERVTGSLAFGALARVVLVTAKLPSTEAGGRLLARAKNNLGADAGGFCYDLEALELEAHPGIHTTRVLWGKAMEGSARDLLSLAETPDDSDEEGSNRDVDDFVRDCLASGPLAAADMQREAKEAGYSFDKIRRSAYRLGVEKRKTGFKAGWTWTLARTPRHEDGTEDGEDVPFQEAPSSPSSHASLPSSAVPFAHHPAEGGPSPSHCEDI